MISERNKVHRLGLLAVAAGLACSAALAQSTGGAPPNAGTVLQTVPPMTIPRSNEAPAIDASRMQAKDPPASVGPKVWVKGFRLSGNTSLPTVLLNAGLKAFENRELTIEEIGEAAETVRDQYRNAGFFLAQALVPSQDVSNGIVEINILEGRIGKTTSKVAADARVPATLVDGYLSLLPPGSTLTEQSVERPLLLLSDLAGTKVHSVLKPGGDLGTADLEVEVSSEGNPYGGSVFLDNYGNRDTGEVRAGVNLEARGLLGKGEVFMVSLIQAANLTTVGGLGATFPVGPLGTKVSLGLTDLAYSVGGDYASLKAKGDGLVATSLVQHPWVRSRNLNVLLLGGLDYKRVTDVPSEGALPIERHITTLRLGAGGDFRDEVGGGALNSYTFSLSQGYNKITDTENFDIDQSPSGYQTAGSFAKVQFEYLRLQSLASFLTDADSLYFSARGQLALNKNLDNIEKVALGGPRGVRAYPVGEASGDDAVVLTAEYRRRMNDLRPFGGNVILTAFYDHGNAKFVHSPSAALSAGNSISLGAAGVGFHLVKKDDFDLRIDVARQVGSSAYQASDNKATRVWGLLQKWF